MADEPIAMTAAELIACPCAERSLSDGTCNRCLQTPTEKDLRAALARSQEEAKVAKAEAYADAARECSLSAGRYLEAMKRYTQDHNYGAVHEAHQRACVAEELAEKLRGKISALSPRAGTVEPAKPSEGWHAESRYEPVGDYVATGQFLRVGPPATRAGEAGATLVEGRFNCMDCGETYVPASHVCADAFDRATTAEAGATDCNARGLSHIWNCVDENHVCEVCDARTEDDARAARSTQAGDGSQEK